MMLSYDGPYAYAAKVCALNLYLLFLSHVPSGWYGSTEVDQRCENSAERLVRISSGAVLWKITDSRARSHPNLPQMVGYSGTDTPTPFILLANGVFQKRAYFSPSHFYPSHSPNSFSAG